MAHFVIKCKTITWSVYTPHFPDSINAVFFILNVVEMNAILCFYVTEKTYTFNMPSLFSHFSLLRLENLSLKQEEDKAEKVQRWEIWIIRIRELQDKCKEKTKDLKSKSEPQNKKDVEEQIILADVSSLNMVN